MTAPESQERAPASACPRSAAEVPVAALPAASPDPPSGGSGGAVTTKTWSVELPAGLRLLSLNDRIHWAVKGRITRDLRKAAWACARNAGVPHMDRARLVVEYQPPQVTRRRDTDNVATASGKPCIDGLVDARVLEDDSPRFLAEVTYRIGNPFPRGRLVLYVTEVTP